MDHFITVECQFYLLFACFVIFICEYDLVVNMLDAQYYRIVHRYCLIDLWICEKLDFVGLLLLEHPILKPGRSMKDG